MISDTLKQKLKEKGQFPYGKRDRAYQSIAGEPGIRDMNHRFKVMNFPKSFDGETVIDFGCSAGAICLEAKKRGAKRVVGLDYKSETIDVAKSLARELNLDIEFYTFNIDDGIHHLKQIIGEDKFDHVFALAIWAHCDENKLADMINHYTDKICWFEGHNAYTYGDTKSKMDTELEKLLDLPYHEYLGETSDRSVRQNYKISRSNLVEMTKKEEFIYYSGDLFNTINESNYDFKEKLPGGAHLIGQNTYVEGKYNFNGKYSCYFADYKNDFGIKVINLNIWTDDIEYSNLSYKREIVEKIFKIQKILSDGGFAPEPHQIVDCHDSQTFHYGISMENLKGKFVQPSEEWIKDLVLFCDKNNISREGWSIEQDCVPKNCIEVNGKTYMVDIDYRWNIGK